MKTGSIYKTNYYGEFTIINYINNSKIEVEFIETGFRTFTTRLKINSGTVRDKLLPTVWGVGFIGDGVIPKESKKAYTAWQAMLRRCYSAEFQNKHPTYKGCHVIEDWLNFQNFERWYTENHPDDGSKYHLDKDILFKGNKRYSPETCIFVSPQENCIAAWAKSYRFISPSGELIPVYNLREFCRENNLNPSSMVKVAKGTASNHKGWLKHEGYDDTLIEGLKLALKNIKGYEDKMYLSFLIKVHERNNNV